MTTMKVKPTAKNIVFKLVQPELKKGALFTATPPEPRYVIEEIGEEVTKVKVGDECIVSGYAHKFNSERNVFVISSEMHVFGVVTRECKEI